MPYVVNPYTFVPCGAAPVRTSLQDCYAGKPLFTGRLDYTLTTDTPLLVPDAAKVVQDAQTEHKQYPFFRLPDGTPAIPGSTMRGAVRSVYEALTHSCMSVLRDSTEKPFSQRLPSTNGFKEHGLLGYDPAAGRWTLYAAQTADFLKLTKDNYSHILQDGRVHWDGQELKNGQPARLHRNAPCGWLQFNRPVIPPKEKTPYYVRLLTKRRDNAVVYRWQDDTPYNALRSVLGESVKNDSKNNLLTAHADLLAALEKVKSGDPAQGGLVPVWYLLADDNGTPRCYLSGASIGRVMQGRSWADVMHRHAPCGDINALCPACALFGTVRGAGTSGRVRFTDAATASYKSLGYKTLPVLSSPRPSAYEFYLEKPAVRGVKFWNYDFYALNGTPRGDPPFLAYRPQPRGRKFYWHSAPKTETQRTKQNATLEALQGRFTGSVYFDRITRDQLEELAFALTLGDNSPAGTRLHKLGHGKPVGYGSCKLTLTGGELRTLTLQNGVPCYHTRPLAPDTLTAAHGRIDPADISVRSLLKIADKQSTHGLTVAYPADPTIFGWFAKNRRKNENLVTLPRPLDKTLTLPCGNPLTAPPPRRGAHQGGGRPHGEEHPHRAEGR